MSALTDLQRLSATGPLSARTLALIERAVSAEEEAREVRDDEEREFARGYRRRREFQRFIGASL